MLLKKSTEVKLKKTFLRVWHIFPAFNDTFVLLAEFDRLQKHCVVHVDK